MHFDYSTLFFWYSTRLRQLLIEERAPRFNSKPTGICIYIFFKISYLCISNANSSNLLAPVDTVLSATAVSSSRRGLELSEEQKRALQRAVSCEDYVLIEGNPGAGKSRTLAALILAELSRPRRSHAACKKIGDCGLDADRCGARVLLAAHTNRALDSVLTLLLEVRCSSPYAITKCIGFINYFCLLDSITLNSFVSAAAAAVCSTKE